MEKIEKLSWKMKTLLGVLLIGLCALVFWWIVKEQFAMRTFTEETVSPGATVLLERGDVLVQPYEAPDGLMNAVEIQSASTSAAMTLRVLRGDEQLGSAAGSGQFTDDGYVRFAFDAPLAVQKGEELTLELTAEENVSLYYGAGISTGRYEVALPGIRMLSVNDAPYDGMLVMRVHAGKELIYVHFFWPAVAIAMLAFVATICRMERRRKKGIPSLLDRLIEMLHRYSFLLEQLITRDFKTKYKRSVLGVLWSFLNPLMTMTVQYVIFSTLFRSNIPYFAVYLLSGTVLFNFFTESVSQGLMGIVSNASLITKVYLPKYIYPISKVCSSAINMLIAFVPLLLVALLMGLPITKAYLLLPLGMLFLIVFCMGMALLLSASMTFFRDTQFLWNIAATLWSYLTPLFYPESIIPQQLIGLYRLNPMYQFITFMRTIIIEGVSPDPVAYLACGAWALGALALGLFVFKKKQDRFVFYL